jgi:hypothetical protein
VNETSSDAATAALVVADEPLPAHATSVPMRAAIAGRNRVRADMATMRLLAQLHPLVPGALQKLLVLLLAHLLPALLD